jgi:polyhydroxyalkanoate synthesis regulator phasin
MMTEVKKMQTTLERMSKDLDPIATRAEHDSIRGAIANLNYLLMQLNNKRYAEAS